MWVVARKFTLCPEIRLAFVFVWPRSSPTHILPHILTCIHGSRFVPYLCIDPEPDPHPGARDAEEDIQVLRVSVSELKRMIRGGGDMMLHSIATSYMALDVLKERGLV